MQVLMTSSPHEMDRWAADAVLAGLPGVRSPGGRSGSRVHPPTLGLATGSSPLGLYAALGADVSREEVDFSTTHRFALDEYVGLPEDHAQSYRRILVDEVCRVIGLGTDRLHAPDGAEVDESELRLKAQHYEQQIQELGGIDVQILGIGANGHLGFNEPGSALSSRARVKRLAARTRADNARFFDSPEAVPTHCLTQGLGTITRARRLVLIASGEAKAHAVAAALEGPLSASCPASILQWHPDAVVVLDTAAAARLGNLRYYADAAAGIATA